MTHTTARKMLIGLGAAALVLTLSACGGGENESQNATPENTNTTSANADRTAANGAAGQAQQDGSAQAAIQTFITHLANIEFAEALELSDPNSPGYAQLQDQLNIIVKNPNSAGIFRPLFGDAFRDATITPVAVEDNRARFQVSVGDTPKTFDMQKLDGQWLVLIPEGLVDMAIKASPTSLLPGSAG